MSANCPKCGKAITRADVRCPQCGVMLQWVKKGERTKAEPPPAEEERRFCTQCGGKLEAGQKFCPACGAPVRGSPVVKPPIGSGARGGGLAASPGRYEKPGLFSCYGRARRTEYWLVWIGLEALFLLIVGMMILHDSFGPLPIIGCCIVVGLGAPVNIRRCHDIGWSGVLIVVFCFVNLIPFVGWLASLIFDIILAFCDGQPCPNQYGPDPKGRNYFRQW